MNHKIELLAEQLASCGDQTLKVAARVPDANRFLQLRPGKAHPLWLVGHLANTINVVIIQWALNGENMVPKGFGKKFAPDFAGGDPISPNAEDYPAWDAVIAIYAEAIQKALEKLKQAADADLPKPLPGRIPEPLRDHFGNVGQTLNIMVSHDSYHRGQLGMLGALRD
ncbi:MAG: DinB family protein [Candidatus Hydrogenedentes bacterium]|nr:DinB family protein [Candidatus Hydrogenedentota bacterium]